MCFPSPPPAGCDGSCCCCRLPPSLCSAARRSPARRFPSANSPSGRRATLWLSEQGVRGALVLSRRALAPSSQVGRFWKCLGFPAAAPPQSPGSLWSEHTPLFFPPYWIFFPTSVCRAEGKRHTAEKRPSPPLRLLVQKKVSGSLQYQSWDMSTYTGQE